MSPLDVVETPPTIPLTPDQRRALYANIKRSVAGPAHLSINRVMRELKARNATGIEIQSVVAIMDGMETILDALDTLETLSKRR